MADTTQPLVGDTYRCANGALLRVIATGTDSINPYRLQLVEMGEAQRNDLFRWAEENTELACGDFELSHISRELNKLENVEERYAWLVAFQMSREVHVEPAWFEHAAVRERTNG